jgi:demethylmenaquinone methyltransferase/2-methoxy-6-polyprenyl-1,4-benzoquinol methylase
MNDVQSLGLHRWWKRRVVQLSRPQPGQLALDLCCGTGDIAFALARRGVAVTGLDFNDAMLAVARARSHSSDTSLPSGTSPAGIQLVRGDAQQLPLKDGVFDIVTVGYGLRNLASWETGLSEMARVAAPGARLLVLDFARPDNRLWRAVYFAYLRLCIPALGRVFAGNAQAYAYILESLEHYPAQAGVHRRMRELGLHHARVVTLLGGMMSINYAEKPR